MPRRDARWGASARPRELHQVRSDRTPLPDTNKCKSTTYDHTKPVSSLGRASNDTKWGKTPYPACKNRGAFVKQKIASISYVRVVYDFVNSPSRSFHAVPNERPRLLRHLGPASFLELFLESRARDGRDIHQTCPRTGVTDVGSALRRARTPTRARLAAAHASHACSRDTRARHSSGARPDRLLRLRAARRPLDRATRAKRWKKHTERREIRDAGSARRRRASFARARRAVVMVATCVHDAPARPLTRLAFLSVPPTPAFSRIKRRRTRHGKLFPAVRATADHDKKNPTSRVERRHVRVKPDVVRRGGRRRRARLRARLAPSTRTPRPCAPELKASPGRTARATRRAPPGRRRRDRAAEGAAEADGADEEEVGVASAEELEAALLAEAEASAAAAEAAADAAAEGTQTAGGLGLRGLSRWFAARAQREAERRCRRARASAATVSRARNSRSALSRAARTTPTPTPPRRRRRTPRRRRAPRLPSRASSASTPRTTCFLGPRRRRRDRGAHRDRPRARCACPRVEAPGRGGGAPPETGEGARRRARARRGDGGGAGGGGGGAAASLKEATAEVAVLKEQLARRASRSPRRAASSRRRRRKWRS